MLAVLSMPLRRSRIPIEKKNIVAEVKAGPQSDLMLLESTDESCREKNEAALDNIKIKKRKLIELSRRLGAVMQTFDRNNIARLREIENASYTVKIRRYLPFFLGDELFAVSIHNVKEVVEANKLIIEPDRPWKTRRAINLKGKVVPVIDLSKHFGGEAIEVSQSSLIVILMWNHGDYQRIIGIMVDAICKVLDFSSSSIEPSVVSRADVRSGLTIGTIEVESCSITLLDISRGLFMGIFPSSLYPKKF
ncbi:chemotaxis protein CheW [Pseudomonas lini]